MQDHSKMSFVEQKKQSLYDDSKVLLYAPKTKRLWVNRKTPR